MSGRTSVDGESSRSSGSGVFAATASLLVDLAAALLLLAWVVDQTVPPQHLAWRPLRLSDPIGSATLVKIERVGADPLACRRVLAEGGVRFSDLPERTAGEFCEVRDALRVEAGATPLAPAGPAMTCRLALGAAVWDRQVLQPAAQDVFGVQVAAVEHYGVYSCRRQYGAATGRVSEHARTNAFDVAGVRLADGRRVTVASDFRDEGPEGEFLRRLRDGACSTFRVVLSPDYNAAHRDHLHLDQGPFRACR